jgi:hypothetical protein
MITSKVPKSQWRVVILNVAAQPKATTKTFHAFNCDVTLDAKRSFLRADSSRRKGDLTFHTLAKFKCFSADAVKTFTTEVFGGGLNLPRSCLS